SFYEKIETHKIKTHKFKNISLVWLNTIIRRNEVIKMDDHEQLKRIAMDEKDLNTLMAWARNPHVSEECLLIGFQSFKNDLNEKQTPMDYADFLYRKKE